MKNTLRGCAIVVIMGLSIAGARGEDEQKIAIGDAPAAVQTAIKSAVGPGTLGKISKEAEDGNTTYEAEFKASDVEKSVTVAEDGSVVEEETEIKAADLPAAVSGAIAKAYPNGKTGDVSIVKANGKTSYEADVEVGDETHEMKIAPDGSVISNKVENENDKNEKEEQGEHKG